MKKTVRPKKMSEPPRPTSGQIAPTKEAMQACCKRVVHFLKTEKCYVHPSYSLWELAKETGMTTRLISTSINTYMGQDFFELINRMRVEEAKSLLCETAKSTQRVSVEEIGIRCGFNSRSAFFFCFKKYAGTSPAKFRMLNEK